MSVRAKHLTGVSGLQRAYHSARRRRLYDKRCYMISNESEYWAEGCQSWFDATVRCGERHWMSPYCKPPMQKPFSPRIIQQLGLSSCVLQMSTPASVLEPS